MTSLTRTGELSVEDALALLKSLGSTDAIAWFLRNQGVTGTQESKCDCPLAVWLSRFTGEQISVWTNATTWRGMWAGDHIAGVPIPPNVLEFIYAFDAGRYPDLIAAVPA